MVGIVTGGRIALIPLVCDWELVLVWFSLYLKPF